jgi:hypothetical protein
MAIFEERLGEWKEMSRPEVAGWVTAYVLFLTYALAERSGFLFLDYANLMIHEAGHPLFGPFGYTSMILGGTLLELLVPLGCAGYFFAKREVAGFAFCAFWFFENFLYIGVYMADARAEELPLVGSGDHDWAILFGRWGLLLRDRSIGEVTRWIGWVGMLSVVIWLGLRARPKPGKHFL